MKPEAPATSDPQQTPTTTTATTAGAPAGDAGRATVSPQGGRAGRRWRAGTLVYTLGGLVALFGWLLWGDFAWQLKERALNPVGQLVLKQFHATNLVIGFLIGALPAALAMVLGPVVCTHSDRHRGRWGRRIPYLLWPTPLVSLSLVGLAFTPELGAALHGVLGARSPGPAAASLVVFSFCWTVSEVAAITAQYLFYGLINDVVPRELHGRFFGMFRAVSLLAGIAFNLWVIGHTEQHFRVVFLGLAVLYGVGFTLMCLRVREGDYPPPEPLPPSRKGDRLAPVRTYFRESFSDPSYVWLYAGTTLAVLAFLPVNTFSVAYAKSIGLAMETYGRYLVLTYVISFSLSYVLGWLADRFHPLLVGIGSIGAYAAVALWAGLFATTPTLFAGCFVAHGVVSGCFFTVLVPIFQRLLPREKFGQLYSAANLLVGFFSIVVPLAVGWMLDVTGQVYRYTFLAGGLLGLLALVAMLVVRRRFLRPGDAKANTAA
jgi:MFS family permease